ncbi:class I SAM-dependent DNA methyltransferase [Xanthobacter dioxanivorans]|uniref:site-specific DNA-methyltransferase (adenine-specific) n=1 Tax=Xanthobacter dioxanivorans TaxID=2528964 RepID=A0A974PLN3_9HYPH|nr:DNA methyltransferase [Xanthobacter dioxanivorans]QRG05628.1 class I SAM-dependent DNA methyltransferase [Xanthobacter dioxanivorans]
MTPHEFITKWQNSKLKERAAAQEHFLDLCRLLGEKTPAEVDAAGLDYGFEVGATKTGGGHGFADVFKRGHFGWEYKGTRANLDAALLQLQRYAVALDNPPLLIVSDIGTTIRIHTNWTNSVSKTYDIPIAELEDAEKRQWLKAAFADPEALRPTKTRQQLTEEVAGKFAELARSLRARYDEPEEVAHFINRLVFCMFAEDVKLLKEGMFSRMLERALEEPAEFEAFARDLFRAMSTGGRIGFEKVAWFNGGLFDNDRVFPLTPAEIRLVHEASKRYWGDIDPSILGTLFERGLDPDKRSQLGAHYTDRDKIMMIIEPVIIAPLAAEWAEAKAEIAALMEKAAALDATAKTQRGKAGSTAKGQATTALNSAQAVLERYLKRLADFRVLDPACGSGNFLYLALRALKDLEHRAQVEAEALGLPRRFPSIGPEVVRGIEINPYAAELARVSVWIGEIQWMLKNGFEAAQNPVLKPLETIECRDAVLNADGTRAEWPEADAVVGNPPFLGVKRMFQVLGVDYVNALRDAYPRVSRFSDLVCWWFEIAAEKIAAGQLKRAGLVATNSIRGGRNRLVLDKISQPSRIYNAWSDEPWVVDGAAVRVSLICFGFQNPVTEQHLNGNIVKFIYSDLTSPDGVQHFDITKSRILLENKSKAFVGTVKGGSFDISGELARHMLLMPINPNGRPNADVIYPYMIGMDVVRRPRDQWVIDFGCERSQEDSAFYEAPFAHVEQEVLPHRLSVRNRREVDQWWLFSRALPALRAAIDPLERFIVTPALAKHRVFAWLPRGIYPDHQLIAIARDDDTAFGILHSRFHELWSLRMCTWLGVGNDPRYTPTTTFETFPFPEGLTPNIPAADCADDPRAIAIAKAAARLNELRENWLNPADLVRREPEVVPGYPDRILPVSPEAEKELKKRTLTNLYNARPTWLANAHKALDEAVAAAYGWPANLSDDEVLARLFALNQERAAAQAKKS